jgi:vacuolar protein sorting-associated protein 26
MSFLFSAPIQVVVIFDRQDERIKIPMVTEKKGTVDVPLFTSKETVKGVVQLQIAPGKSLQHGGITAEVIGQIEMFDDRGSHYEFTSLQQELESAGDFTTSKSYNFDFANVDKQYESYNGMNVRLRYFIRVTIRRQFSPNIVKETDFWVHSSSPEPDINNSIKMEVGIEDCLHIEFEYNKSKYHLRDAVTGKVYFLLVRIKIKHMEVAIIKRESTGAGPNLYNQSDTVTKFEVMDGAPVRGESIPIRLFLEGHDLTPTFRNVHSKFSVKYYLNLVLVDEEDRRYFKQQEITLYRPEA